MADAMLEFRGLKELADDFDRVASHYPDEAVNAMMRVAKKFIDDTTERMPSYYSYGRYALNDSKNWNRKRIASDFFGHTLGVGVTCSAPHWHLVENGHWLWVNGHDTGQFCHGKHYVEKESKVYKEKFPAEMRIWVDKMLKEHNL